MLLLNTPIGLNPVDDFVLRNIPEIGKCGIVVNGGDGRLSKAIYERWGIGTVVYNIESRPQLYEYLAGAEETKSKDPWNVEWYSKIAAKHGGIDFICFINIHEYWDGNLYTMQQILSYLRPEGVGCISFYNKNSMYEMRQSIPPFVADFEQLANPMNRWAKTDLASWVIYLLDVGVIVDQVWGMLENEGFEYCQENKKKPVIWQEKNLAVNIEDMGDAFIFGAPAICMKFHVSKEGEVFNPQFFGVQYDASMLQSILFPYLGVLHNEGNIFRAHLEMGKRIKEEEEGLFLLNLLNSQLDDFQEIKDVLVVGCNWGMDLLALKKLRPDWIITGIEGSAEIVEIAKERMKSENISIAYFDSEGKFPFQDNAFDLVISLKYFSTIYYSLANELAKEMDRVARKGIVHFEDLRGPDFSMQLKLYSIPDIYTALGYKPEIKAVLIEDEDTGLYIVKITK